MVAAPTVFLYPWIRGYVWFNSCVYLSPVWLYVVCYMLYAVRCVLYLRVAGGPLHDLRESQC